MTEKQLLDLQRTNNRLYLLMMGQFYHAYNEAAFAMARITGYKILPKKRKMGTIYQLGFGVGQISTVKSLCAQHGIEMVKEDDRGLLWSFTGGDTSFDATMVSQPKPKPAPASTSAEDSWAETFPLQNFSNDPKQPLDSVLKKHQRKLALLELIDVDVTRIYGKAVQLQNFSMRLLSPELEKAKKYRFTVLAELLKLSTRLVEQTDMLEFDFGKERMKRAKQIAVLARTYATTIGNLRVLNGGVISAAEEADAAVIIAALEGEAKAAWWKCYNKDKKSGRNSKEDYPPTECVV